jgi:hypothetical protein
MIEAEFFSTALATPTECVPFLAIAVSSITSTASLPPTSLSAWTSSSVSQALLPRPRRNEVVQLIAFAERKPPRHRLNALAIARADQPRYVDIWRRALCPNRSRNGLGQRPSSSFQFNVLPTMVGPPKADHP